MQISQAIELFQAHLCQRGFKKGSVILRTQSLRYLSNYLQVKDITVLGKVSPKSIMQYAAYLRRYRSKNSTNLSQSTIITRFTSVKLFFRFLCEENYLLIDVAKDLKVPRRENCLSDRFLTLAEVETMLRLPDLTTALGLRDRALMETFYSTGLRRAELRLLHIGDLNMQQGTLSVRFAKNDKTRLVPIGERALHWIKLYLQDSRPQLLRNRNPAELFISNRGNGLSQGAAGKIFENYKSEAGIEKRGACHLLRHSMATHMLNGGCDIRYIQEMLGHSSLCSTEIYTKVDMTNLREAYLTHHPLNSFAA